MGNTNELHVIFGAGPLGLAVMRELVKRGKRVRLVSRSGKAVTPATVETVKADAYDHAATAKVCQGATVVYQCAQPPYHQWPEKFPSLQSNIVRGAAVNRAKLIVGENLYMYGAVTRPLQEDLPYMAQTRKGRTRAQMAKELLAAHKTGAVRVSIGRASDFFGPYVLDSMMGERVFLPALQGKTAATVGNLNLPHTYTFIDDFGKALVTLGAREEALGEIWHVPNAETVTTRQFITMIFEEIGRPPKLSGMGKMLLRLGGLFIPAARETVEMMYEFEKPFVVDNSKYVRAFGDHATPLREAIRQTVAWYRQYAENKS